MKNWIKGGVIGIILGAVIIFFGGALCTIITPAGGKRSFLCDLIRIISLENIYSLISSLVLAFAIGAIIGLLIDKRKNKN